MSSEIQKLTPNRCSCKTDKPKGMLVQWSNSIHPVVIHAHTYTLFEDDLRAAQSKYSFDLRSRLRPRRPARTAGQRHRKLVVCSGSIYNPALVLNIRLSKVWQLYFRLLYASFPSQIGKRLQSGGVHQVIIMDGEKAERQGGGLALLFLPPLCPRCLQTGERCPLHEECPWLAVFAF